jgi:hypothetical protein
MPPKSKKSVTLTFREKEAFRWVDDPVHKDLSAAARSGDTLFVSCDETAGVDRLTPEGKGWGNHAHFSLGDFIKLPGGPDGEMDVEGLEIDEGWLWIVGSHSLKRARPEGSGGAAMTRMETLERDPNRAFLGRLPLVEREDGLAPMAADGDRRMNVIRLRKNKDRLRRWLKKDPLLADFLGIPCKENGFDIEGLAADGLRVWVGLRGPVLRGHAVILEFGFKVTGKGRLKPRRIDGRRRYRKHLLPTNGQGVRDLVRDGDDLLVLTGPALSGDGAAAILRWRNGRCDTSSGVVAEDRVVRAQTLPYAGDRDHPEGLAHWEGDWLVIYDNPAKTRLKENPAQVTADIITL